MSKKSKLKSKNPLKGVRVYDNPLYFDRYTVVIPNNDVFTMSSNPLSPQGMNQYVGTIGRDFGGFDIERDAEKINKSKLPLSVRKAIIKRIKDTE